MSATTLTKIHCPKCGSTLKPNKPVPIGTQVKCPKCAAGFVTQANGTPTKGKTPGNESIRSAARKAPKPVPRPALEEAEAAVEDDVEEVAEAVEDDVEEVAEAVEDDDEVVAEAVEDDDEVVAEAVEDDDDEVVAEAVEDDDEEDRRPAARKKLSGKKRKGADDDDEDEKDRPRRKSGSSSRKAKAARSRDRDEEDDEDDDEDDLSNRLKKKRKKKSGGSLLPILLIGGLCLALFVCGGGGLGLYFAMGGEFGIGLVDSHDAVVRDMIRVMNEQGDIYATIKDENSARAAVPRLKALRARAEAIKARWEKMPKPTPEHDKALKNRYEKDLQSAISRLVTEGMRAQSLRGVRTILREADSGGAPGTGLPLF